VYASGGSNSSETSVGIAS